MPPTATKKLVNQGNPEPAMEPIQPTNIIVIQLGSRNLRIGRASEATPHIIPHCIARLQKQPHKQALYEDQMLARGDGILTAATKQKARDAMHLVEDILRNVTDINGAGREQINSREVYSFNTSMQAEKSDMICQNKWTNIETMEDIIIGDEAMNLSPGAPYNVHWPIKFGRFNLHKGPGGTVSAIIQDLEDMWGRIIKDHLGIPLRELSQYRAALLVPDLYNRLHMREVLAMLLTRLKFSAAFLHLESVCATYAAGVSSACVVDIGDQKMAVCCVDDGLVQRKTRISQEFGGADVTRLFHTLLVKNGLPYRDCSLRSRSDVELLREWKETYCHLDVEYDGMADAHVQVKRPGKKIVKYVIKMADERIIAPLALFHPDLLGIQGEQLVRICEAGPRSDPQDPHDDFYLSQTRSKHEQVLNVTSLLNDVVRIQAARRRAEQRKRKNMDREDDDLDDDDDMDDDEYVQSDLLAREKEEDIMWDEDRGLVGLDHAILHSVEQCENEEMKRRMYNCIVVVGGSFSFHQAQACLEQRLWPIIPPHLRHDTQEIITRAKDLDPRIICWRGAAVLCCLDTTQELWIRQTEWRRFGTKMIRERAPFAW